MKPNVIYLHSHDTGRYIEPYGHAVPAPHLARLAREGVLFRQAFCAAPTCSPSRAALLTGRAAHSVGQLGLVNRGIEIADPRLHLAQTLHDAGYHTALFGVHHVRRDPHSIAYDEVETPPRAASGRPRHDRSGQIAAAAVQFLRRRATDPSQPFFAAIGFPDTHRPFPEPAPESARFAPVPAPLPDVPEIRADMAAYLAAVQHLDHAAGMVLDELDRLGLADDTIVVCTTDHGLAFPMMKCNLTDHGMGVMLMLRGPAPLRAGTVNDSLVSHIDVYPTLCELLELPPPAGLQGRSLVPLLTGEREEVNEAIFAEINFHCSYEPARAVRTARWKYIRRFDDRRTPLLANCDASPSKDYLLANGWDDASFLSAYEPEQLYDLAFDPGETDNLAHEQRCAAQLQQMRDRLAGWMAATEDPLLRGPIAPPAGAIVSRPNDTDPADVWGYTEKPAGLA